MKVEISLLDVLIVTIYLVVMVVIGICLMRCIRNTDDFYVAGRSLGPFVLMATVCATTLGGSAMLGRAGIAYGRDVAESICSKGWKER